MRDVTLTRYLIAKQKFHPEATGEFTDLINRIAFCGKLVARELRRSQLAGRTGSAHHENVSGDEQKKLDVVANDIFVTHLEYGSIVTLAASEELDEPAVFATERERGSYVVCFDPIDGSSNLDVNGTLGTIFGIRRRRAGSLADLFTSGREQVAAGYILYGPATQFVLASGGEVAVFTYEGETGEFFLTQDRLRMPTKGTNYAVNEGNSHFWHEEMRRFVANLKTPDPKTGKTHRTRYSASLVGDFHRILLEGGIYLYPEDTSDPAKPNGKLRILYECHPLAFVAEAAGGRASTGKGPVLDVIPEKPHARCPLAIGSESEVALYEKYVRESE
jgi:fructose-1,6-bisphosphatase I